MATETTTSSNKYAPNAQRAQFRSRVDELMRKRKDPEYVRFALEQVGYDTSVIDQELGRYQAVATGQAVPQESQPSVDLTPAKQQELVTENSSRSTLIANAKEYKALVDEYGFESTVTNPEIAGKMGGLRSGLLADIKKAETLGTLDKGLLDFADMLLGVDPTGPLAPVRNIGGSQSKLISSKIDELISNSTSKIEENNKLLGVAPAAIKLNTPEEAAKWLEANPSDPRAEKVKAKLESVGYKSSLTASPAPESSAADGLNEPKSGFAADVSESFTKRTDKNADILNSTDSTGSKILQVTGQNLGLFSDVVGSAVVNTLKAVTPDFIEKPAKEKIAELVTAGLETEVAKKTVASWEGFKESNPEMARNIEATGNIANFFALGYGSGVGAKASKEVAGTVATKAGSAIVASGDDAARVAKESFSQELIMPIADKATKVSQVGRTTEKGRGIFKQNVVTPSATEKKMAEEVLKVEGVSPSQTLQQNYNAIQQAVATESDDLITRLSANDFIVSKKEVISRLKTAAAKLNESPIVVGESEKMAEKLLAGAQRFINENSGTGSGMLKARKAYDAWVLKQKPKAFDAKAENAFTVANREVRGVINQLLDEKAPSVGVKESLKKQSTLLNALDNIAPKAAKEADTAIGRAADRMFSMVKAESKLGKYVTTLTAAIGLSGGLALSPGVMAAAGGTVVAAKLVKALGNPKLRQGFGKILKEVGSKLAPEEKRVLEKLLKKR